jgi:hypothetical protein
MLQLVYLVALVEQTAVKLDFTVSGCPFPLH